MINNMKRVYLISIFSFLLIGCSSTTDKIGNSIKEVEYKNIIYKEVVDNKPVNACISFKKDNTYSTNNCNNESTDYFFDNKNECTFKYDGTYIKFDCKNNSSVDFDSIKILQWDKYTFKFLYGDEEKVFKSLSWLEENFKEDK